MVNSRCPNVGAGPLIANMTARDGPAQGATGTSISYGNHGKLFCDFPDTAADGGEGVGGTLSMAARIPTIAWSRAAASAGMAKRW